MLGRKNKTSFLFLTDGLAPGCEEEESEVADGVVGHLGHQQKGQAIREL